VKRRESSKHDTQRSFQWGRKCSPFVPRARTVPSKRLSRVERQEAIQLYAGLERRRPRTREDCAGQPRPCPWVSCRYNLYLDVSGKSIKFNFPDREPHEMPATGSCALDVADRVALGEPISLAGIGKLMNLGIERVRQLSSVALQAARIKQMWEDSLHKVRIPVEARRKP
jgi:hypothetical protein